MPAGCARCRGWPAGLTALAATAYDGAAESVVHALKYAGWRHLAGVCAERLASALAGRDSRPELLVPVPLHRTRLRERGFNQAAVIAEALAERLERPVYGALVRTRATASQVGLSRAGRAANMEGAFAVTGGLAPRARIGLVDDVATSGATLAAAAIPLIEAGAATVVGLTFALAAGEPRG